jgi:hypothetical protein
MRAFIARRMHCENFSHQSRSRMHKGFTRDARWTSRSFHDRFPRFLRARNEKNPDCARKISLTVCDNFITQHTKQPSDDIHQPLSKISCDPHLRIERGDY